MIRRWQVSIGPVTHLLMDGGILLVDKPDEFHEAYIKDLAAGKRLYVVEKKTDTFKFFVDLDHQADYKLDSSQIIGLATKMNLVTKHRCLIALTPTRVVSGKIKTGVHFHWPDLLVTKADAIKLRNQIIMSLPEGTDWDKAIDASVYSGSGLRMIWSHKREGTTDFEPYRPWKTVSPGGNVSSLPPEPALDTLKLFSVRTEEDPKKNETLNKDFTKLEQHINKYMEGHSTARVLRVFKTKSDVTHCVQTDSRYCENIGKSHRRNHIWFRIRRGVICQMCLDDDCKEFVGKPYNLPPSIIAELQDGDVVEIDSCNFSFRDVFSVSKKPR
jgi:hypothetical protein